MDENGNAKRNLMVGAVSRRCLSSASCTRSGERGGALLEFLISLPVFLLLSAAAIDLGWAIAGSMTVVQTSKEGARMFSSLELEAPGSLQTARAALTSFVQERLATEQRLQLITIVGTVPAAAPTPLATASGVGFCDRTVTVRLEAEYQAILPGLLGLRSTYPLSHAVSMRYSDPETCA